MILEIKPETSGKSREGWKPLAHLFQRVSLLLAQWLQPAVQAYQQRHTPLASFASEVVAVDETYLDKVSRRLPILRHFKNRDPQLLAGKLVTLFDVRLQQWRAIDYIAQGSSDGKKQARSLLTSCVKQGALVLADARLLQLISWFDDLTARGYSWISRGKRVHVSGSSAYLLRRRRNWFFDWCGWEWWIAKRNTLCDRSNFARGPC